MYIDGFKSGILRTGFTRVICDEVAAGRDAGPVGFSFFGPFRTYNARVCDSAAVGDCRVPDKFDGIGTLDIAGGKSLGEPPPFIGRTDVPSAFVVRVLDEVPVFHFLACKPVNDGEGVCG